MVAESFDAALPQGNPENPLWERAGLKMGEGIVFNLCALRERAYGFEAWETKHSGVSQNMDMLRYLFGHNYLEISLCVF